MNEKKFYDKPGFWILVGALNAGMSVSMGAYAAHMLYGKVSDVTLTTFYKGVKYQMYHGLALILVSLLMIHSSSDLKMYKIVAWIFFIGIIIFSGSMYLIVLAGINWVGYLTPIGGIGFVVAWVFMGYQAWKDFQ